MHSEPNRDCKEVQRVIKSTRNQRGFSLLELSMVLVVIGLIIGATVVGSNLQRNALFQKINTGFVQGWAQAYQSYFTRTGIVVGDDPTTPTLQVNKGTGELCTTLLQTAMDAAGVRMPAGRAEGQEDRASYLDSNGNPQEVQVCFNNVPWAVVSTAPGTYVKRNRNVMVLKNLTPALARSLDASIDGKPDARFGRFREQSQADQNTTTTGQPWSIDNRMKFGSTTATSQDESQVAVVTAYYLMQE